jgi:formylglycine-generating enzyme required for sulfatase activity
MLVARPRLHMVLGLALAAAAPACKAEGGAPEAPAPDGGAPVAIAPNGKVMEAAENEADADAGGGRRAPRQAREGERVDVPAGAFVAGSTPGDRGRDPTLEPALLGVELGAFSIDRNAYPNDPTKPPLTGVTRGRAAELCQERGGRLCTELEWERACKGPDGTAYAGASAWEAECARAPGTCASGFDVAGMGAMREWTASDVAPVQDVTVKAASARGARRDASDVDRRCAHRSAVDPSATGDDLGFRCCYGAPNAATIPGAKWEQTFRRVELGVPEVTAMFASVPQLAALGTDLSYFNEPSATKDVLARADAGAPEGVTLTTSPLLWNPVPGEEILVLAVQAAKDAAIVAFYRLPDERYRIASTLVMKGERGPIVIGFSGYVRKRMTWGTCWDCRGESGFLTYRDDGRVVITQK